LVAGPTITLGYQSLAYRIPPHRGGAGDFQDVACVGETVTPFGATGTPAFTEAKAKNLTAIVLNLYGWNLVHALGGRSERSTNPHF
jgi:hypothetical protein